MLIVLTWVSLAEYDDLLASWEAAMRSEVGLTVARSLVFITMRRSPSSSRSREFHWLGEPYAWKVIESK